MWVQTARRAVADAKAAVHETIGTHADWLDSIGGECADLSVKKITLSTCPLSVI